MVSGINRRSLLTCAGAAAACAVAGCSRHPVATPVVKPSAGPTDVTPTTAKVTDVPVGGGLILDVRDGVVVTQPVAGQIMAFSAVCPHEGCTVSEVADGEMICPCHGSRFRITDGSVTRGPAKKRLDPVTVKVVDGVVTFP